MNLSCVLISNTWLQPFAEAYAATVQALSGADGFGCKHIYIYMCDTGSPRHVRNSHCQLAATCHVSRKKHLPWVAHWFSVFQEPRLADCANLMVSYTNQCYQWTSPAGIAELKSSHRQSSGGPRSFGGQASMRSMSRLPTKSAELAPVQAGGTLEISRSLWTRVIRLLSII